MRRREAAAVFKEIIKCIPDAFISRITLTQSNYEKQGFELRISANLDAENIESIQSLVTKNGLNLKKDEGSLLVYGCKKAALAPGFKNYLLS
jgi:hypothetical protein